MPEFLLEVGCEEIPARWLPQLTVDLKEGFQDRAVEHNLFEHGSVPSSKTCSTPRRLVLSAQVPPAQRPDRLQVWGPPLSMARDATGNWTRAAEAFAAKCGVRPEDLSTGLKGTPDPTAQYLLFKKQPRASFEVLPSVIAGVLRYLAFPKRMSWDAWLEDGKGAFPFGRPIRWLVALLDGEVVPFSIYAMKGGARGEVAVRSGGSTYGHRFLPRGSGGGPIRVRSYADLRLKLEASFVVLESATRHARIQDQLAKEAPLADFGLLAEWRELVEYPTVLFGRIPPEFRSLPTEVLQTVLVHHQKYIPIGAEGHITRFAALTNTDRSAEVEIVRGMERVVVARLRDAAFFYGEDMKRPLGDRVDDLAGVTFHQGLGTYKDKADRLVRLVDAMGEEMGILTRTEHDAAREAARLAKADLTTLMVREFPELQGVMGGIYLKAQGHPWQNVASAVHWQYHPLSVEEGSPPAGALEGSDATVFGALSLADKLDTLAGCFGLGLVPSGSSDPYGLRRAAQGAVRVLLDFWVADSAERRPSLRRLVAAAFAGYGERLARPREEAARELEAFLAERLRYVLAARGFPADEVEAVLGAREPDALEDPHEAWLRLQALHRVRSEAREDFEHLAVAFKRAKNILVQGATSQVQPGLLKEAAERDLHQAVESLREDGGYEARLRSLAGLRGPVDRFFDDVLVMAEDPSLRANRLGLLGRAVSLFYRIADISKLGG